MKLFLTSLLLSFTVTSVYAASITLDAPTQASVDRRPLSVIVSLDPESDEISGVAGSFSFPDELFEVKNISLDGSVASLWLTEPTVSKELSIDGRIHINFEAVFPGGFRGVRSAFYSGGKPGTLFKVTLVPKGKGEGTFLVDDITINSFSPDAHPLPSYSQEKTITVPELSPKAVQPDIEERQIENTTLSAFLTRDELVSRGAWYLMIYEQLSPSPIKAVYVSESNRYGSGNVPSREWHEVSIPYVLYYQDRTKYVHVKVLYSDDTYVLRTLPPVENSVSNSLKVGILVLIVGVCFVLLLYGKTALFSLIKHGNK